MKLYELLAALQADVAVTDPNGFMDQLLSQAINTIRYDIRLDAAIKRLIDTNPQFAALYEALAHA